MATTITDRLSGSSSSAESAFVTDIDHIDSTIKTGSDGKVVTGTAGASGQFASWDANGDVVDSGVAVSAAVTLTGTQTLTNKTLTSPTINTATISGTLTLTGAMVGAGYDITGIGVLTMVEQAAAEADVAGRGQWWVQTATPNVPMFTDDAGTDQQVATLAKENQPLTGGATVTSKDLGTQSSGTLTLDMGDRPLQHYINGGSHTLAPGSVAGACIVDITNNASAGTITVSGWTKTAGDDFDTTNTNKFRCHCSVGEAGSLLVVQAMQ